ncbi:hypothetical protein Bca4012_069520 [Brassica carinata]
MGAAEARALWQRTSAGRCFVVHEDSKMAPRLASCHHHQRSSSGNTEKGSFFLEVLEISLAIPNGGLRDHLDSMRRLQTLSLKMLPNARNYINSST